ncbi:MAG TPA: NAD(P)H-binding protein [Armatimonadota bacterium]|nr:NAD(P)H-binding protein [Armatimonadota bacterium]HOM71590.1 NAD(P)H-binding protein [Armatimonadota bacterium]
MADADLNVVTGAFGYTGRHITRRLLVRGKRVKTLTGHPDRPHEFGQRVTAVPYNFDNPKALTESLKGASVLFNTYWIRFSLKGLTFSKAVENSRTLIKAAENAGVRRIIHVSITNPSVDSPFPYYRGKAEVEKIITQSKMSYVILRPNVLFGDEGILINNIAWLLRRSPIFAVPGSGEYKVQPMFVQDLADMAVNLAERDENIVLDAVGPEIYTFNDLVKMIGEKVGTKVSLVHISPEIFLKLANIIGKLVGDVILTKEEVEGLIADLLVSNQPPTGWTALSEWLSENNTWIGKQYMSEIKKHYSQSSQH